MTSNSQPPVICLMGPTASGKTALGVHLAQAIKGEIISVDSALVYRGMDVGTAKPSLAERGGVPHHLIDILDPTEAYSTGQFREQALGHIDDIIKRGRQPILVGGTMLYFSALTQGLAQLPAADTALRQRLDEEAQRFGNLHMHEKLRQIDPESAQRIHVNDPQRVQRALEVFELSGQPLSQLVKQAEPNRLPYRFIKLVVMPEARLTLHQRIEQRVDHMLSQGLVAEVEALRLRGDLNLEMPSMRCVGYRQVWSYLDGEYDYPTMRDKVLFATRQLAKRQLTWLRKESDASILYSDAHDINQQLLAFIKSCLNH